jgi:penicillin-binding protein 1A
MPLKLTCPHCNGPTRLSEPYPAAGAEVICDACAQPLAVNYPPGVIEQLRARGKQFAEPPRPRPKAPPPPPPKAVTATKTGNPDRPTARTEAGTQYETVVEADTKVASEDGPSYIEFDRTVPSGRSPYGALPGNADEPEATPRKDPFAPTPEPIKRRSRDATPKAGSRFGKIFGCFGSAGAVGVGGAAIGLVIGLGGTIGGYWYFAKDLPSVQMLEEYQPPTVTTVLDRNGKILGEIYDERRYVVPLETIPKHVQNAFIDAEDAGFWEHNGVDYIGILRALERNTVEGKKAQGASTITQQVTRNFLLTREKSYVRKIKEILLAWRIESTYDKEHILYLYLNEIYLGSSTYGVEAASRVYFGKHVEELTLGEAALIAGLPPAPSAYSPHKDWKQAKWRQKYVLEQMVANGHVTQAEADAAAAEEIRIVPQRNEFLLQAPHFTEYVRRYLVDKYGEDQVLQKGLQVTTTCDLDLQKLAQGRIVDGVQDIDSRLGFRRSAIKSIPANQIKSHRAEADQKYRKSWANQQDPAGRTEPPATLTLQVGHRYEAVVLEVDRTWARVAIGQREGLVPIAWSRWMYEPDPRRSWRGREATDLTAESDGDGDGKKDGPLLRKGDLVTVAVRALSVGEPDVAGAFSKIAGAKDDVAAVEILQRPEVQAALLSFDLKTGAVRAMVGGADFTESQFNRAIQAQRQVGSTFKPIVYGAAIESQKVTSASLLLDAPLALPTDDESGMYKPSNYSASYEGDMTLRRALAQSKNTCTVRLMDRVDPGMNGDVVYQFARKLGLGGPPSNELPDDWVPKPDNDRLCPWVLEKPKSTICMDRFPPKDAGISNTEHRRRMKPGDEYWCRACDYSMSLGSASLTMEELARAYSVFGTGGKLVQPYYIESVADRSGKVLESHQQAEFPQVVEPGVATVTNWLMQSVVLEGTAHDANALGLHLAGKTGTSQDEKDTWFVGMNPNVITAVWVGYDQPRSLGASSTGGRTALPIWIDYMKVAAPKSEDRAFPLAGDVEWAQIDERTGSVVTSGGRNYLFLKDTVPTSSGLAAGQVGTDDPTGL